MTANSVLFQINMNKKRETYGIGSGCQSVKQGCKSKTKKQVKSPQAIKQDLIE